MDINSQILLFLSAIGAFNGILIALYFLASRSRPLSDRFFAGMLFMFSVRILKSVLYYFNPDLPMPLLQIGLSACFLIGPFFYFYTLSRLNILNTQWVNWKLHLSFLVLIIVGGGLMFSYETRPDLWGMYFYRGINYVWIFYLGLSSLIIIPRLIRTFSKTTKLYLKEELLWLSLLLGGNLIVWASYFIASRKSYIIGPLSFSLIFYALYLLYVWQKNTKAERGTTKYANKKIDAVEATRLSRRLAEIMKTEKIYQNPNLTLPQLAQRLKISTPVLSQLLNDNLQTSFSTYINKFRIEEAKTLLSAEQKIKMDVIFEECGFNSQSTFYTAFKKVTQTTPAKYRENLQG